MKPSGRWDPRTVGLAVSFAVIPAALSLRFLSFLARDRAPLFLFCLAILVAVASAVLAVALAAPEPPAIGDRSARWAGGVLALLMLAWILYLFGGTPWMPVGAPLVLAAAAAFALAILTRPRAGTIAALAVLSSVLIAWRLTATEPFAASAGDMLDLIDLAVTRVLAGQFPYEDLRVPGAEALAYSARPVPYPPAMWLVYLPFRAAGLDLRLLPILATGVLGVLLWRAAVRSGAAPLADVLLPALYLAPIFILRVISIQTPPHWLLLSAIVLAVRAGVRAPWVGVLSGVALGMRETTLVVVPLLVLYYWSRAARQAVGFLAGLAVTFLAIIVPFLVVDAEAFVSSMVYNAAYVIRLERPLNHIGFGPWVANSAGPGVATTIQAGLCVAVYLFAYRRMRGPADLAVLMGVAILAFMLFNPLIHEYYYLTALLLISLGLFLRGDPSSGSVAGSGEGVLTT